MHKALGAELTHGLDADADVHADFAVRHADAFEQLLPGFGPGLGAEADLVELLPLSVEAGVSRS